MASVVLLMPAPTEADGGAPYRALGYSTANTDYGDVSAVAADPSAPAILRRLVVVHSGDLRWIVLRTAPGHHHGPGRYRPAVVGSL